jgi:hypothetical protein
VQCDITTKLMLNALELPAPDAGAFLRFVLGRIEAMAAPA